MVRFIFTSDWHIGRSSIIDDDLKQFSRELNDYCKQNDINILIHGGDVFDRPRPMPQDYWLFGHLLHTIALGFDRFDFYIIEGNHDVGGNIRALRPFYNDGLSIFGSIQHGNYRVFVPGIDGGFARIGEEFNIAFAPYSADGRDQEVVEIGSGLEQYPFKVDALVFHGDVAGAKYSIERDLAINSVRCVSSSVVQYVLCGHIHLKQVVQRGNSIFIYAGSPVCVDFGESKEEKGFLDCVWDGGLLTYKFIRRLEPLVWGTIDYSELLEVAR